MTAESFAYDPTKPRTFTPGPYHVEAGRAIVNSRGDLIATGQARKNVYGYENTPPAIQPVEADANAYLLAASWDMRHALKLITTFTTHALAARNASSPTLTAKVKIMAADIETIREIAKGALDILENNS